MRDLMNSVSGALTVAFLTVFCIQCVSSVTEEEVKELQKVFSELQEENARLNNECDFLRKENKKLWTEVNRLANDVRDVQQYTRIDNVEIAGIPQKPNENIFVILEKVCNALGISFNLEEISEAHRLPKGRQDYPFIVVRFVSRRTRDKWLNAAKMKKCNVQQIIPDGPPTPFYINQHLTTHKKSLLDMGKRLVGEGIYSFAWVKDGKVYVRKTPTSEVIRIKTFQDFENYPYNVTSADN